MATAFRERLVVLKDRARRSGGLTSVPIIRIDGYNMDEVTGRDVLTTQQNVRRRYYGEPDRYP